MTSSPKSGPLSGLFDQVRSFLKKPEPTPVEASVIHGTKVSQNLVNYSAILYNLKKKCSEESSRLTDKTAQCQRQAHDYFAQAQVLEEQIHCLEKLAQRSQGWDTASQKQYEALVARMSALDQLGTHQGDLSLSCSDLARRYSKLVIELQICIYKVRALTDDQAMEVGEQLLLAFQSRCQELELLEAQLFPNLATDPDPVAQPTEHVVIP